MKANPLGENAAAALLTRERVLSEDGYKKSLDVWIDKHAGRSEGLKAMALMVLNYSAVAATLPPLKEL